jgi:chemotaxis protein methyltransferase CheR
MDLDDLDYALFVRNVKQLTTIDLSLYKETQMKRRLASFCRKKGFHSFTMFYSAMKNDLRLRREFCDRMTINVSEFWRNASRWATLAEKFLPEMLACGGRIRCWSAACSTGEEPYTLAMILSEMNTLHRADIWASDLDEGALNAAAQGIYPVRSIREVPASYVSNYFRQNGMNFHVSDELKKAVVFHKQNLLEDRFESNFDLIICRNVLIYFTEDAKAKLYAKLSQALRPGGVLFVGSTEQIFSPERYELKSAETFFYRKM